MHVRFLDAKSQKLLSEWKSKIGWPEFEFHNNLQEIFRAFDNLESLKPNFAANFLEESKWSHQQSTENIFYVKEPYSISNFVDTLDYVEKIVELKELLDTHARINRNNQGRYQLLQLDLEEIEKCLLPHLYHTFNELVAVTFQNQNEAGEKNNEPIFNATVAQLFFSIPEDKEFKFIETIDFVKKELIKDPILSLKLEELDGRLLTYFNFKFIVSFPTQQHSFVIETMNQLKKYGIKINPDNEEALRIYIIRFPKSVNAMLNALQKIVHQCNRGNMSNLAIIPVIFNRMITWQAQPNFYERMSNFDLEDLEKALTILEKDGNKTSLQQFEWLLSCQDRNDVVGVAEGISKLITVAKAIHLPSDRVDAFVKIILDDSKNAKSIGVLIKSLYGHNGGDLLFNSQIPSLIQMKRSHFEKILHGNFLKSYHSRLITLTQLLSLFNLSNEAIEDLTKGWIVFRNCSYHILTNEFDISNARILVHIQKISLYPFDEQAIIAKMFKCPHNSERNILSLRKLKDILIKNNLPWQDPNYCKSFVSVCNSLQEVSWPFHEIQENEYDLINQEIFMLLCEQQGKFALKKWIILLHLRKEGFIANVTGFCRDYHVEYIINIMMLLEEKGISLPSSEIIKKMMEAARIVPRQLLGSLFEMPQNPVNIHTIMQKIKELDKVTERDLDSILTEKPALPFSVPEFKH